MSYYAKSDATDNEAVKIDYSSIQTSIQLSIDRLIKKCEASPQRLYRFLEKAYQRLNKISQQEVECNKLQKGDITSESSLQPSQIDKADMPSVARREEVGQRQKGNEANYSFLFSALKFAAAITQVALATTSAVLLIPALYSIPPIPLIFAAFAVSGFVLGSIGSYLRSVYASPKQAESPEQNNNMVSGLSSTAKTYGAVGKDNENTMEAVPAPTKNTSARNHLSVLTSATKAASSLFGFFCACASKGSGAYDEKKPLLITESPKR